MHDVEHRVLTSAFSVAMLQCEAEQEAGTEVETEVVITGGIQLQSPDSPGPSSHGGLP